MKLLRQFYPKVCETHCTHAVLPLVGVFASILLIVGIISASGPDVHYWTNSSGDNLWSTPSNWSTGSVPDSESPVVFNSSSLGSVTIDIPVSIASLTVSSGYTGTITASTPGTIIIAGSLQAQNNGAIMFGSATWDIGEDFDLENFSNTATLSGSTINVAGNVIFGGTVLPGTSTLVLDGNDGITQSIFNADGYTINNLVKVSTGSSTIAIEENTILTISGALTLDGLSMSNPITITSVTDAGVSTLNHHELVLSVEPNIENVSFEYSDCSGVAPSCLPFGGDYREATPFTTLGWFPARGPGGLTTSLAVWLRSDAHVYEGSGDLAETGDSVSEWHDVSGNDSHVIQNTSTNRPVVLNSALNINELYPNLNYHPVIRFDGSNDYLEGADGFASTFFSFVISSDSDIPDIENSQNHSPLSFEVDDTWLDNNPPIGVVDVDGYTYDNAGIIFGSTPSNTCDAGTGNVTWSSPVYGISYAIGINIQPNPYNWYSFNRSITTDLYARNIPRIFSVREGSLAIGNRGDTFLNNKKISNDSVPTSGYGSSYDSFANRRYFVGSYMSNGTVATQNPAPSCAYTYDYSPSVGPAWHFDGRVSEIISYDRNPTDTELQRVDSYLALKYGVTLDQSSGGKDYLASDGTTEMWDKDFSGASNYDNTISGIGRDDASGLYQTRSRSQEEVFRDAFEIKDPQDLDNLEFLTWGSDGSGYDESSIYGAYTPQSIESQSETPNGYNRLVREWQVQETGDVGTVTVVADTGVFASFPDYVYMLVDNDGDFSDATPVVMEYENVGTGQWVLDYDFNGGEYITFARRLILHEFASSTGSVLEGQSGSVDVVINGYVRTPRYILVHDFGTGTASVSDYTFTTPIIGYLPPGQYDGTLLTSVNVPGVATAEDFDIESLETIDFFNALTGGYNVIDDVDNDGVARENMQFSIVDNDSPNVFITPTAISIYESGYSSYTLVLTTTIPVGQNVVVVATPESSEIDLGAGPGQPLSITFSSLNWNIPQTVNVLAIDNNDNGPEVLNTIINHTINTSLTTYSEYDFVVVQSVDVEILDDDEPAGALVYGCMDPDATNYNINAQISNGSCQYDDTFGCTDPLATNYNPLAVVDDGLCQFDDVSGCTDSLAINYNISATFDDGSCVFPVYGCTNSGASNYDEDANVDDGSCIYPIYGCTDSLALNYNPVATVSTETCDYPVLGCNDPIALNYDPDVDQNNGSCTYPYNDPNIHGCTNGEATNYNPEATLDDFSCQFPILDEPFENPNIPEGIPLIEDIQNTFNTPGGTIWSRLITTLGVFFGLLTTIVNHAGATPGHLWSLFLSALGIRKKPWGVVYDSVTKQPLDPVFVTLADESGNVVGTSVTDVEGRYGFLIKPGAYRMYVHRSNYDFPSTKLASKKQDEMYSDLYFGELFTVLRDNEVVAKNIPMDPLAFDWNEFVKRRDNLMQTFNKRSHGLVVFTNVLFALGFGVSIVALLATPNVYNGVVFGLYVAIALLQRARLKPRTFGKLTKRGTKEPLSFAIIHIISDVTGIEVTRKVADQFGRYMCFVPNGLYTILVDQRAVDGAYSRVSSVSGVEVSKGYLGKDIEI